jgi:hypothetical protein
MLGQALDKLIGELKNGFFSVKPADATTALQETQDRIRKLEDQVAALSPKA